MDVSSPSPSVDYATDSAAVAILAGRCDLIHSISFLRKNRISNYNEMGVFLNS